jgi:two-component system sensor histidine kinase KdpD
MDVPTRPVPRLATAAMPWRRRAAYAVAVAGPLLIALVLGPIREEVNHALITLVLLVPVVGAAWIAGLAPGIVGAVVGSALFNFVFIPPYGTFKVERGEYVAVLVGFAAAAVIISVLVARAQERAAAAEAREAEVRVLYELSRDLADGGGTPEGLALVLSRTAERFGFVSAVVRPPGQEDPEDAPLPRFTLDVGPDELGMLVLVGDRAPLSATEGRVLRTFADQLALTLQAQRLEHAAREAEVLQRTDALRRSLLATASHELKSPVAAITAAVTDLLDRGEAAQPGEVADVLEDVRASTSRLEQLITNLLDMSRIESGTLVAKIRAVDLSETVPPAVVSVIARWPDVDIGAEVPTDAIVRGDPVFVERVVVNLLENAARSVRAGRDRRVMLSTARAGSDVVVRVADHGPGLDPDDRALLFTPFYRLGERSQRLGAGLGLAICKGFVEAMHGTIWTEETPGGGATFAFRLPSA